MAWLSQTGTSSTGEQLGRGMDRWASARRCRRDKKASFAKCIGSGYRLNCVTFGKEP
jgi:hypothetical protein